MLTLSEAGVRIAQRPLFGPLDVAVGSGDRICLVGRNGAGKSTLLKALAGAIELDAGSRHLQPRTAIVYLPQEPELPADGSARDAVMLGLPADQRPDGAWQADSLLAELGTDPAMPVAGMSGGEARRVSLARALIARPDVLLLDEPTNHLDITAIEWLEETLAAIRGGIVTISHDRSFLRRLSTGTWWLDRGQLHTQDQGYEHFEAWSEQLLDAEAAATARLDKKLGAETHWLHRGVTARRKRNMGRLRRLHELRAARRGLIARTGSVKLEAAAGRAGGSLVIEATGIVKRFGQRTVIDGFSTRIMKGDRIGVIGPNGAGKSTLVKLLLGEMPPDAGTVRHGTELQVARFEQDRASLDLAATPWEILCPEGGDQVMVRGRWRHVVGYLRDFLFRDDQVRTPLRALSGGERNRLLLARILARPANLLVLDEPTNDLDMDTLDLLTETLADFEGTLILVSHDRDFLDRLVTSTIAFEGDGRVREYAGGYADWLAQRVPPPTPRERVASPARPARPTAPPPGLDAKLARELDRLPARITAAEAAVRAAEEALADPTLFRRDATMFERSTKALEQAKAELARLEDRWLELEALRETAEA